MYIKADTKKQFEKLKTAGKKTLVYKRKRLSIDKLIEVSANVDKRYLNDDELKACKDDTCVPFLDFWAY